MKHVILIYHYFYKQSFIYMLHNLLARNNIPSCIFFCTDKHSIYRSKYKNYWYNVSMYRMFTLSMKLCWKVLSNKENFQCLWMACCLSLEKPPWNILKYCSLGSISNLFWTMSSKHSGYYVSFWMLCFTWSKLIWYLLIVCITSTTKRRIMRAYC